MICVFFAFSACRGEEKQKTLKWESTDENGIRLQVELPDRTHKILERIDATITIENRSDSKTIVFMWKPLRLVVEYEFSEIQPERGAVRTIEKTHFGELYDRDNYMGDVQLLKLRPGQMCRFRENLNSQFDFSWTARATGSAVFNYNLLPWDPTQVGQVRVDGIVFDIRGLGQPLFEVLEAPDSE
jgi:hypothetical protein